MMLTAGFLLLTLATFTHGQSCSNGQVWMECGSPCTKYCWDRTPMCIEVCEEKCECPKGRPYWDARNSTCLTDSQCDALGFVVTTTRTRTSFPTAKPTAIPEKECPQCLGGYCSDTSGKCPYGCERGLYGWDCSMRCDDNCEAWMCHPDTGYCTLGCQDGYDGPFCQDYCGQDCGCKGYGCIDPSAEPWPNSAPGVLTPLLSTLLLLGCTLLLG